MASKKITREPKEFLSQITTYADAITAFSILQAIAFTLAVASAEKFIKTLQLYHRSILVILFLAVPIYWLMLFWCHRTEDKLVETSDDSNIKSALLVIRVCRYVFAAVAMGLCIAMAWRPS
jgi:cytochrome c biogenesis protein CcdA